VPAPPAPGDVAAPSVETVSPPPPASATGAPTAATAPAPTVEPPPPAPSASGGAPSLPPGFVTTKAAEEEVAPPPPPSVAPPPPPAEHLPPPAADEALPPEPEHPREIVDPNGVGAVIPLMSAGSMRTGRIALGILTALLEPTEQVECLVQGVYQSYIAVGALTDKRVLLVNEQEWVPRVRSIELGTELLVQGWQDDRTASLIFLHEGRSITLSGISDRQLAQDFAQRLRARVAGLDA
jgi:hypothetical protein